MQQLSRTPRREKRFSSPFYPRPDCNCDTRRDFGIFLFGISPPGVGSPSDMCAWTQMFFVVFPAYLVSRVLTISAAIARGRLDLIRWHSYKKQKGSHTRRHIFSTVSPGILGTCGAPFWNPLPAPTSFSSHCSIDEQHKDPGRHSCLSPVLPAAWTQISHCRSESRANLCFPGVYAHRNCRKRNACRAALDQRGTRVEIILYFVP